VLVAANSGFALLAATLARDSTIVALAPPNGSAFFARWQRGLGRASVASPAALAAALRVRVPPRCRLAAPAPAAPPPPAAPPDVCAATFRNCLAGRCCRAPRDGCFRRVGKLWAMCKPMAAGGEEACGDSEEWLCPGWWARNGTA
jgi:hypothetical protein